MASNVSLQMVRNSAAKPSSQFVHYMCCRWSWYHHHLHNYTPWSVVLIRESFAWTCSAAAFLRNNFTLSSNREKWDWWYYIM